MATVANPSLSDLTNQVYDYVRRGPFGTGDMVCMRKDGQTHVRPTTECSFLQDTSTLSYEIVLRTRIPVVHEVLKYHSGTTSSFTLKNGSRIRVISSSALLYTAFQDSAAIIREDESLVIWSTELRSIASKFTAISRGLRQYVDYCGRDKLGQLSGLVLPGNDGFADWGFQGPYLSDESLSTIGNWVYSQSSGLRSLSELTHLHDLRGSTTISGDHLGLFGEQQLTISEDMQPVSSGSPYYGPGITPYRRLSPLSAPSSQWSSPYLSSSPSSEAVTMGSTPQTVCLADISPPPPILSITEVQTLQPPAPDVMGSSTSATDMFTDSRVSSPSPSPSLLATTPPPLPIPQPVAQSLAGSYCYVAPTTPLHRTRLRPSSIATSVVLPNISKSTRERQARALTPQRVTPYPRRKPASTASADTSASLIATTIKRSRRAPRRAPSTRTTRQQKDPKPPPSAPASSVAQSTACDKVPVDDDLSDLTDVEEDGKGDSDDEYCERPAARRPSHAHVAAKFKNPKQASAVRKQKRRKSSSSNACKKASRKFHCGREDKGCTQRFTRVGDTIRHMYHSCDLRKHKDLKPFDTLCLLCGVHQARSDALKRHVRDRHRFPEGKFPQGHIEGLVADGKLPDYAARYRERTAEARAEEEEEVNALLRKYRVEEGSNADDLVNAEPSGDDVKLMVGNDEKDADGSDDGDDESADDDDDERFN